MWPPELRQDLRSGLAAKHKGDLETSARYLYRAWQNSKTLPLSSFKSQPLLKTTGIAICLGEVLEQDNQPQAAYEVYAEALDQIHQLTQGSGETGIVLHPLEQGMTTSQSQQATTPESTQVSLSGAEELRAISLAHKLGELAVELEKPPAEQEKYLTEAVERLLKNTTITTTATSVKSQQQQNAPSTPSSGAVGEQYQVTGHNREFLDQPLDGEAHTTIVELGLPEWATTVDFAAPLAALARFHGDHDKPEQVCNAIVSARDLSPYPTSSSAIVSSRQMPRGDRPGSGAQMMNSLAELVMRSVTASDAKISPQQAAATLHQAETWIRKALEVTSSARKSLGPNQMEGDCEIALASSLFNAGLLRELNGDSTAAKKFYTSTMEQFKRLNLQEGVEEIQTAIKRLEAKTSGSS
ncbi:hypothetical protein AX16_010551 [Volvariella volvacea WC 439]|nr:hypothetical protein AX16_010551 [Volvariella volvacea WC 439]